MPQTVQVDGVGTIEFPDEATPEQIQQTLNETYPAKPTQKPSFVRKWFGGIIPGVEQEVGKAEGGFLKGIGAALETIPIGAGSTVPGLSSFLEGTQPDIAKENERRRQLLQHPLELRKALETNPLVQAGRDFSEHAATDFPVPPESEKALTTQIARTVGGFIPAVATGPLAPLEIGVQMAGEHMDADFDAAKAQGATDDQAADIAYKRALASGATAAAIWALLPGPLRRASDKWIINKFAPAVGESAVKRFLLGRAASTATQTPLMAASAAGEAAVTGEPVLPAAARGAGAGLVFGALSPHGLSPKEAEAQRALLGPPQPTIDPRARAWAASFGAAGPEIETAIQRPEVRLAQPPPPVPIQPGSMRQELPESFEFWMDQELARRGYDRDTISAMTANNKRRLLSLPEQPSQGTIGGPLTAALPPAPAPAPAPERTETYDTTRIGPVGEHIGTPPGTVVPPQPAEVRAVESQPDRGGGGAVGGEAGTPEVKTPVAPEPVAGYEKMVGRTVTVPKKLTTTSTPIPTDVQLESVTKGQSRTGREIHYFNFNDGQSVGVQVESGAGTANYTPEQAFDQALARIKGTVKPAEPPAPTPKPPDEPPPAQPPVVESVPAGRETGATLAAPDEPPIPAQGGFAAKAVPALNARIGELHNLLIDSDAFGRSEFYSQTFPIPRQGGIIAAKYTERYRADPAYAAEVDAAVKDITDTMVRANRQRMALMDHPNRGAFGVDYSVVPQKARATYGVNVVRAWHNEAKQKYPYTNRLGNISIREAFQNSLDAVIAAMQARQIKKGEIKIDVDRYSHTGFMVDDNGIGMSDTDIGAKFLSLHSTGKAVEGRFGGFGIAKAVILGPSDTGTWILHTRDNRFTHEMAQANDVVETVTPPRQGTSIEVTTKDYIIDDEAKRYVESTELPKDVAVLYDGKETTNPFKRLKAERTTVVVNDQTEYDLAYYPNSPSGYGQKLVIRLVDAKTGAKLTQAIIDNGGEGFRGTIIADVRTKAVPGTDAYPLTDSRMELKWNSGSAIRDLTEKKSIDVLSAKRAGMENRWEKVEYRKEWDDIKQKVENQQDADYLNLTKVIEEVWNETGHFFGAADQRPFTPLADLELKIDTGYRGYTGGSMFQAKHLAAYEAVARLLSHDTGAPVTKFYGMLVKPVGGGTVGAEHGSGGEMGLNFLLINKAALKDPLSYAFYLRDLVIHELTHEFHSPHNEEFVSRESRLKEQTNHLFPKIVKIAEAVVGKELELGKKVVEKKVVVEKRVEVPVEKRVEVPVEKLTFVDRYLTPEQQEFIYDNAERPAENSAKDELYYPRQEPSGQLELQPRREGERPAGLGGVPEDAGVGRGPEQPGTPSVAGAEPGSVGTGEIVSGGTAAPERITAAAYRPSPDAPVETGPHHPGILKRLGIPGFETRESRNTPEFGYQTNLRDFVPRGDEAARIAKEAGQQLEPFDIDPATGEEMPHSDEIAAKPGGTTAISETKPIPPRQLPAYGIDSKAEAKKYGLPEDFYFEGGINPDYLTPEYEAALAEEAKWRDAQGINATTGRRMARERTAAAFADLVAKAREKAAPEPTPEKPKFEGTTPDGTRVENYVKREGRWYRVNDDGSIGEIPTNRKVHNQLEARAGEPPPPPETRTPEQILKQAAQVRVKLPEGATVVRITDNKGKKTQLFIADLNRGENVLRGVDVAKIEPGHIDKSGKFAAIEGDVQVSEVSKTRQALAAGTSGQIPVNFAGGSGVLIPPDIGITRRFPAYHGTPHEVDRFTTAKIGTGEGAQVYGWGLYFAENKAVAEEYHKNLTRNLSYLYDGKPYDDTDPRHLAVDQLDATAHGYLQGAWRKDHPNADELRAKAIEASLSHAENFPQQYRNLWLKTAQVLRDKGEAEKTSKGGIYTVDLLAKPEELLDWDKPLSQQSTVVRNALERVIAEHRKSTPGNQQLGIDPSGEEIYRFLSQSETPIPGTAFKQPASPKNASHFLNLSGIKGIRYLDQGSRLDESVMIGDRAFKATERGSNSELAAYAFLKGGETKRGALDFLNSEMQKLDALNRTAGTDMLRGAVARAIEIVEDFELKRIPKTYNYVIFDENVIRILDKNGQRVSTDEVKRAIAQQRPQGAVGKGMSPAAVESHIKQTYGIDAGPESKMRVVNDPTAGWSAQVHLGITPESVRGPDGQFQKRLLYIEVNAAKVASPAEIDWSIEHEFAHNAAEEISLPLRVVSQTEFAGIMREVEKAGYPSGEIWDEFKARAIHNLAASLRKSRLAARILPTSRIMVR